MEIVVQQEIQLAWADVQALRALLRIQFAVIRSVAKINIFADVVRVAHRAEIARKDVRL